MPSHYLCNHCLKKIGGWYTMDNMDVVMFPSTGLRFHRRCWNKMPKREKMRVIRASMRRK